MEILEAYCRTVLVTAQLGKPPNTMTPQQLQDLLKIKQSLAFPIRAIGLKECELCDNDEWRPGVQCAVPASPCRSRSPTRPPKRSVQAITDQIMEQLK